MIVQEVKLLTDPLYSREATQNQKENSTSRNSKPKLKTYGTGSRENCQCCNQSHDLDECLVYLKKPVDKRKRFLFEKKLCFGCYQPISAEHSAKTCKNQRKL